MPLKFFIPSIAIILLVLLSVTMCFAQPAPPVVHVAEFSDYMVNPITAEYLGQAIARAEKQSAQCLIIRLDTPGGLLTSTRQIVKSILAAKVPVVVYVAPDGARAGSAGVFITYASHVAAMSPSTNIGAAHPVDLGGSRKNDRNPWEDLKDVFEQTKPSAPPQSSAKKIPTETSQPPIPDENALESKILQDTVAFIKSLAQLRGRNSDWAIKSVAKSASITASEALALGVVEIVAADEKDLLNQLDGRTVRLPGAVVTLATKSALVEHFPMSQRQNFFNILAHPNIAYILMVLGFYGLLYEITHPGFGAPGFVGAMLLILSFVSLQALPTNYAGVALILLAVALFAVEAFVTGFGILALGGIVSMVLGSLLLFDASTQILRVSISLIAAVTLATAAKLNLAEKQA